MNITISRKAGEPLTFQCRPHEKILYAALQNRLTVPYECATGTCGSCRAKLVSGALNYGWRDAPGLKALKVDRGEFLMCQCSALSDCEIRIPSAVSVSDSDLATPDHLAGTITDFNKLTDDVMSFCITLENEVSFQAGQFALLQLPGVDGARAYSMVNYAPHTDRLEFVIKQYKGGKVSEWLFEKSLSSAAVTLFGPLGHAVFEPQLQRNLLLLAGGSGIAGMMAMLQQADQIGYLEKHSVDLIFGVRSSQDMFYVTELKKLAATYPDTLKITIALSDVADAVGSNDIASDSAEPLDKLKIARGFVHEQINSVRADTDTMAFIAGPPPMVDASIRELVGSKGFSAEQIRYDKFA